MPCPVGGRMSRFGKLGEVGASELESDLADWCSFGGRWNWWRIRKTVRKLDINLKPTKILEMSTFPRTKSLSKRFFCRSERSKVFFGIADLTVQETEARVDEEIKSLRRTETDLRRAIAAHRPLAEIWRKADEHEDPDESERIVFFFSNMLKQQKKRWKKQDFHKLIFCELFLLRSKMCCFLFFIFLKQRLLLQVCGSAYDQRQAVASFNGVKLQSGWRELRGWQNSEVK